MSLRGCTPLFFVSTSCCVAMTHVCFEIGCSLSREFSSLSIAPREGIFSKPQFSWALGLIHMLGCRKMITASR